MTSPVHFSEIRHLSHSPTSHRHEEPSSKMLLGQLARDFYSQSKLHNEFLEKLADENKRIINLLEGLDQRVNELSNRILRIEDMVLQPFRASSSRKD